MEQKIELESLYYVCIQIVDYSLQLCKSKF